MKLIEAVTLAYRDALHRGELDYSAFERAVAVYRERHPDAARAQVNLEVARMIPVASSQLSA
jgi:hypothetical protein